MKTFEVTGLLGERHFNNSICEFNGKSYMAYRAEGEWDKETTRICLAEMYKTFTSPKKQWNVSIPQPTPTSGFFEDPRLFVYKDRLWVSFIVAKVYNGNHYACQAVGRFSEDLQSLDRIFYPGIGYNWNEVSKGNGILSREKNWTFFSHEGKIHVIYTINALKVGVMDEITGEVEFISTTKIDSDWNYGDIHGGTPPVEIDGELVALFHSFSPRNGQRFYHVGAYAIDPKTWRITKISEKPLFSAEVNDALDIRPLNQLYRPSVVFPCGLIKKEDKFLISYGWNDCRSMIGELKKSELLSNMKEVSQYYQERYKIRDVFCSIPGGYRCTVRGIQLQGSSWKALLRHAQNFNVKDIELHDALCERLPEPIKSKQWHLIK